MPQKFAVLSVKFLQYSTLYYVFDWYPEQSSSLFTLAAPLECHLLLSLVYHNRSLSIVFKLFSRLFQKLLSFSAGRDGVVVRLVLQNERSDHFFSFIFTDEKVNASDDVRKIERTSESSREKQNERR